jgi:hypothetical protein
MTGDSGKAHLYHLLTSVVSPGAPVLREVPLGTPHLLLLPIHVESTHDIARLVLPSPLLFERTYELDTQLDVACEHLASDIATIDQPHRWHEIAGLHDQMHRFFFPTGLGQMHFVPHPFGVPLAASACICLIGRNDPLSILDCGAILPVHHTIDALEMLGPYMLQEHQTGAIPHLLGSVLVHRGLQQLPAIFSHLSVQGLLGRLSFGQALQLKAMHKPIKPVRADDPKQLVWCHFCEFIEALSHTGPAYSTLAHSPAPTSNPCAA